jgi:hypothetical protein
MGNTNGEILPVAVGVAASPVPATAVFLMFFSERAAANAPGFVAGWVLGIGGATG